MDLWDDGDEIEEAVRSQASADYPELADTIEAHPPLPHSERVSKKVTASWLLVDDHGSILAGPFSDSRDAQDMADQFGGTVVKQDDGDITDGTGVETASPMEVSRAGSKEAGFGDWLIDKAVDFAQNLADQPDPFTQQSFDSCRFRRSNHCMFPSAPDPYGTQQAGYPVWRVEDRGICPRQAWGDQESCPLYEPGPNTNRPDALHECTENWEDGGQRGGRPVPVRTNPDDIIPHLKWAPQDIGLRHPDDLFDPANPPDWS